MKRNRILRRVFVAAMICMVVTAFTRRPFGQSYCVKTGTAGVCTNFLVNQKVDLLGNLYRGYASKNTQCPQLCATQIRLLDQ
jgi:hypothetical protein